MNFDFDDDLKQLRDEAHKTLARLGARTRTRQLLDGAPADGGLWNTLVELGWPAASLPQVHGGLGLGPLAACVLAEAIGYAAAPVPFSSSVCLATEALLAFGSEAQQAQWLPRLAQGSAVGTLALQEGRGAVAASHMQARVRAGRIEGEKSPVPDLAQASLAVVVAPDEQGRWLHLVELAQPQVVREAVATLDESRPQGRAGFLGAACEALPGAVQWQAVRHLMDRAAVMMAFEQVGGAQAALEMARDYALGRYAFGRPIGSFQAIKHKLADVYVSIELARSSAYYGAWALHRNAPELAAAAAAARIAATDAAWQATRENVQTHGGMGYTWDLDCHIYYRRARMQAQALGGAHEWKQRLMDAISPRSPRHGS